jgi:hypothetical protein
VAGPVKRNRGGQIGNQNARKHGFYSSVLRKNEAAEVEVATEVEGLDDEIALFRVKIKSLVENDPDNIKLIMRALNSLERLVRTRYNISRDDKKGLKDRVASVLKDVALPLAVVATNLKK